MRVTREALRTVRRQMRRKRQQERSKQLSTARRIFVRWPETDRGPARVTVNVGGVVSDSDESEITPDDATMDVSYRDGAA